MNILDLVVGKPIKTSDERAEQIGPAQGIPTHRQAELLTDAPQDCAGSGPLALSSVIRHQQTAKRDTAAWLLPLLGGLFSSRMLAPDALVLRVNAILTHSAGYVDRENPCNPVHLKHTPTCMRSARRAAGPGSA